MKKINKKLTVTISLFILSGCVIGPGWYKERVSYDDTQNVLSKCKYDIGLARVKSNEKPELISDCMISQGYRYKNYSHTY